ncbi:hypothetical protein KJ853_00925 [Patescibacteria group bacterium]|nr:hypothetical protein [Patescibacteria group bacterium]
MHSVYKSYQNNVYRFDFEKDKYPSRSFEWNFISCLNWEWGWVEEFNQNYLISYPYNYGKEITKEEALRCNQEKTQVRCSICKKDMGCDYKGYEDLVGFYELPLCPNCYLGMRKIFDEKKHLCDVCRFGGQITAATRKSKAGQTAMGIEYVCTEHYIDELEEKINKRWWQKF